MSLESIVKSNVKTAPDGLSQVYDMVKSLKPGAVEYLKANPVMVIVKGLIEGAVGGFVYAGIHRVVNYFTRPKTEKPKYTLGIALNAGSALLEVAVTLPMFSNPLWIAYRAGVFLLRHFVYKKTYDALYKNYAAPDPSKNNPAPT